jgi:hypothetical protein
LAAFVAGSDEIRNDPLQIALHYTGYCPLSHNRQEQSAVFRQLIAVQMGEVIGKICPVIYLQEQIRL